jgi:aminoglycoside 3-N-acetyltransferase
MSEHSVIERTGDKPITQASLIKDLARIGIKPGMTLLVHASLSSLGWVCGGAVAVINALEEALTPQGTLVMPAHSSGLSDPAHWENPPVPEPWWDVIRQQMPAFDPSLTPTRDMGMIAETFRKQSGVARSGHPCASFSAWGKHRDYVLMDDHYDFAQNEQSPLGRVYELDGYVLLLGVGYDKNTSFHLAEYKAHFPGKTTVPDGFPVIREGSRSWYTAMDILYKPEDFPDIGAALERDGLVKRDTVGIATSLFFSQPSSVDYAVSWIERNRS